MLLPPHHQLLTVGDARAVLAQARDDAPICAGVSLLLLAGLRPTEVEVLQVADYRPDTRQLAIRASRRPRVIRIAPTAGTALDAYLKTQSTDPEDYLLPELSSTRLVQLVRGVAAAAGVGAGVHDLRRAAIDAVLDDGAPVAHVEHYFGLAVAPRDRKGLTAPPEGYDAGIAAVLEQVFA
ncbi:hypothetical protein [Streptomyces sp. NPDC001404]|uniref:hypothetical protein n=1 Tax=Streptomyces sp. NPDC001404 TaxID=3364571 RepID=UPI0036BF0E77